MSRQELRSVHDGSTRQFATLERFGKGGNRMYLPGNHHPRHFQKRRVERSHNLLTASDWEQEQNTQIYPEENKGIRTQWVDHHRYPQIPR